MISEKDVKDWLEMEYQQPTSVLPAAVRDQHGCIVLHDGREVCYRDEVIFVMQQLQSGTSLTAS